MATYKDLVGTAVRNNAGNIPTAETGQVWFDSTNLDFKYLFPATIASWRTTGSLNTARYVAGGNVGTSSSEGLAFGGAGPIANTEDWNGATWTEVYDLNNSRSGLGGFGVNTAGIGAGGYTPATPPGPAGYTESWNGSSWTEVNDLNATRYGMASAGPSTAGIIAGGGGAADMEVTTETWNGSAWTEVADLNK